MALPLVLLVAGAVGVLTLAGQPGAAERRRRERARELRRAADQCLVQAWISIAQDPWSHPAMRRTAWALASGFKRFWIDAGRSGRRLPTELKVQIYGNWCGPGHGAGPCLDEIDRACRDHDVAYRDAAMVEDGLA